MISHGTHLPVVLQAVINEAEYKYAMPSRDPLRLLVTVISMVAVGVQAAEANASVTCVEGMK